MEIHKKSLIPISRELRRKQTPWESKLWYYLRGGRFEDHKFKRQVMVGEYIVDFCCNKKKLTIEIDGGQHNNIKNSANDETRDAYLKKYGYVVLRFWNNEIDENLEGVLESIRLALNEISTSPSPLQAWRGKNMQAVILAAGLGTRMGELTRNRPKPLLTIENQTLLERNIASLPHDIDEVVLVVGYLKEQIQSKLGEEFLGKKITYVEQKELKGTAHALFICKDVLSGRFLVLMGDDLYRKEDLKQMLMHPLCVMVWELREDDLKNDHQAAVKVDEFGQLVDIVERQPAVKGSYVNCGAYVLDERYFALPPVSAGNKTEEFGLPQTMLQLLHQNAKIDIVKATWWHKVVGPEDLKLA